MQKLNDLGKLFLRLAAGGLMLFHGYADLTKGIGDVVQALQSHGVPSFVAYGVYLGEVLAPILILLGVGARLGGILIAGTMVMAVFTAHQGQFFKLDDYGAWSLEINGFYFLTALAIACLGSGRWSVSRGRFPWD